MLVVSLIGTAVAALAAGQRDDMPISMSLALNLLALVLFGTAALVLSWPSIVKTTRSAHLVWPRECKFARYPILRRVEHESGCRAWARDLEFDSATDPSGCPVEFASCRRCHAKHEQRYIPDGHPERLKYPGL
jgi:hypothetical protein